MGVAWVTHGYVLMLLDRLGALFGSSETVDVVKCEPREWRTQACVRVGTMLVASLRTYTVPATIC